MSNGKCVCTKHHGIAHTIHFSNELRDEYELTLIKEYGKRGLATFIEKTGKTPKEIIEERNLKEQEREELEQRTKIAINRLGDKLGEKLVALFRENPDLMDKFLSPKKHMRIITK